MITMTIKGVSIILSSNGMICYATYDWVRHGSYFKTSKHSPQLVTRYLTKIARNSHIEEHFVILILLTSGSVTLSKS